MPRKTGPAPRVALERTRGFNEAAARCRGKRRDARRAQAGAGRFNEAAARCRGKLGRARAPRTARGARFNEAAARCRGKRRMTATVEQIGGRRLQ